MCSVADASGDRVAEHGKFSNLCSIIYVTWCRIWPCPTLPHHVDLSNFGTHKREPNSRVPRAVTRAQTVLLGVALDVLSDLWQYIACW